VDSKSRVKDTRCKNSFHRTADVTAEICRLHSASDVSSYEWAINV
jgi:hypothetical protein